MITEDYVSFETAKLLKEKGFDEPIEMLIREDGTRYHADTNSVSRKRHIILRNSEINMYSTDLSCPTLQMAMKWLREKGMVVLVDFEVDYDEGENGCRRCHEPLWYFFVYRLCDRYQVSDEDVSFESPEQACEAAIKYCLENLI